MVDEAVASPLAPVLDAGQMRALAHYGQEITLGAGEMLLHEGSPSDYMYLLLSGEIRLTRRVSGEDMVVAVYGPGQFTGELSLLTGGLSVMSAQSIDTSRVRRISAAELREVLSSATPLANILLAALTLRVPDAEAIRQQHEKFVALGTLAAGLAHQLNNPAASIQRAASQLEYSVSAITSTPYYGSKVTLGYEAQVRAFALEILEARDPHIPTDPVVLSDREDGLYLWFEKRHITPRNELIAVLARYDTPLDCVDRFVSTVPLHEIDLALEQLEGVLDAPLLVGEIKRGAARISKLVDAVKAYTFMDSDELQEVDIHKGLDSTLAMLSYKLLDVTVNKQYWPSLPHITAYGSELNQVWTHLIDNACDAMNLHGTLTLRTELEGTSVLVEVIDDGPGIPPELQTRIFEPFFTTKEMSDGVGLGLDLCYRMVVTHHHGDIRVLSRPGRTCFQVRLPLSQG